MKQELIEYLAAYKTEKSVLVPEAEGKVHYLCGLYDKHCLNKAEEFLKVVHNTKKAGPSLRHFIEQVEAETITVDSLPFYSKDIFFNLNTSADYEYLINNFYRNL
jgi:molybdopterin-guanine dinucleotide biosynthesis protein A